MSDKQLANNQKASALSREATRTGERYISPAVDIFETEEGLTLVADVPGLSEKSLNISIEQGILTIEGEAAAGMGDFMYREFAMTGYWRQFQLPESLDAEKAKADVKHGVLTLHLPKAEAAKPKRIEITVH
jgi:HSP20 family molecular chaperone IbpA